MTIVAAGTLGLLTGLHAATWGAYKDSPFEGFRWRSYLRSIGVGATLALLVAMTTHLENSQSAVVLVGLFYTMERLSTEWWKTFVRDDDQSAYSIPMRLGYRGRPVDNHRIRHAVGVTFAVSLAVACWAVAETQLLLPVLPHWTLVVVGGVGGWLTAFGGAWKDAPVEGFSGWKFLRSPVVATAWALPLSYITDQWVLLALVSGGFAVASIETYKTFLTGGRPPGKFADKPPLFQLPATRRLLALFHAGLWATLALTLIVQLAGKVQGLTWVNIAGATPHIAVLVIAGLSAAASALALGGHVRTPR